MEKGGGFTDWEAFVRALRLRFGLSIYDDPLGKIAKLVQTGRVSAFREEFEQLMTRISGVPEQYFLNYFIWGLKTEIRRELLLSRPSDLAEAMAKAQLYEDRHDDILTRARGESYRSNWTPKVTPTYTPTAGSNSTFPKSGVTPTAASIVATSKQPSSSMPIKRLTPAKIKEK